MSSGAVAGAPGAGNDQVAGGDRLQPGGAGGRGQAFLAFRSLVDEDTQVDTAGVGRRAERDAVRVHMLGAGCTHAEVADELQRRFGFRPREALRHAHGWTQNEVAARFIHVAARATGRRPISAPAVGEAGTRIGEYERWPVGGRQPSLYVLVVLAQVYATTVHQLLDAQDWQALPVRDRIVATAITSATAAATTSEPGVGEDSYSSWRKR